MKKTFIFILVLICFVPAVSFAAELSLQSTKNGFAPNEEFLVKVFLNTEDISVNAVEGTVVFPFSSLEVKEIRDGNSAINFWVEKPHIAEDGEVVFSGITTGGLYGNKIFLFGIVFRSKKSDNNSIVFKNVQVLQNDGLGTRVSVDSTPFTFSVSEEFKDSVPEDLTVVDTDPPESFTPFVTSDPEIFDGKYFLVFSTVDKGVGMGRYEVREGYWDEYVIAESPHLLKDQSLRKRIFVKAIDRYGNKRVTEVKPINTNPQLEPGIIFGIILLICILLLKKIWLKFRK